MTGTRGDPWNPIAFGAVPTLVAETMAPLQRGAQIASCPRVRVRRHLGPGPPVDNGLVVGPGVGPPSELFEEERDANGSAGIA
jgi:hypothetical protein